MITYPIRMSITSKAGSTVETDRGEVIAIDYFHTVEITIDGETAVLSCASTRDQAIDEAADRMETALSWLKAQRTPRTLGNLPKMERGNA